MKKTIIAIMCVFNITTAYAENANISTSQYYVDTATATRQDAVPANNANTVMTYDSTSSDGIGTKAIYDTTAAYSEQKSALITADTANAAIQNGINGEFTCANPPKCNLWNFAGIYQQNNPTPHAAGKNLLDPSFMDNSTYGDATVYGVTVNNAKILPTENGKTYTLSADLIYTNTFYYYIRGILPDGGVIIPNGANYMWVNIYGRSGNTPVTFTFTTENNAKYYVYFAGNSGTAAAAKASLTISNYQMEEGDTATAYEPYQNLYIPQNVQ